MAYPAGCIQLSNERDYPVLRQVLHAGFVTHAQLFELMRFCGAWSPPWGVQLESEAAGCSRAAVAAPTARLRQAAGAM